MTNSTKTSRKNKRNKSQYNPGKNFFCIPHAVLDHPDFLSMNWSSQCLLIHMCRKYNGFNNGDISIPLSDMKPKGWASSTLDDAKKELVKNNWVITTRAGSKKICSLFGIAWIPIDDNPDKYDADFKYIQPRSLK